MQPRNPARSFAIVLFCLIGIAVINDYSHHRYQGVTNPREVLAPLFAVFRDYKEISLYKLVDEYAKDPKKVEGMGKVAVLAQILKETPLNATEGGGSDKDEKVGADFRVFRRFSETGTEEGAHVITISVHCAKASSELEPNMWVMVKGNVKASPGSTPDAAQPMIEATGVTPCEAPAPENMILSPREGQPSEGGEDEHEH